ncbi:hypothetical protein E1A91_D10G119700v1 [Gossypium mustelinum]|uniref:Uncharacterized protein n=1 Tax=Gossypium mustelinum TaxID=34275 RepID=A0A5D2T8Q7_GOSMU|nr:hypothetical protein E1A91_D10G119700v1 [Gossypium mustelinum]
MSYRFFFCKTFSIPFLRLASHFLLISFPPYFLSVHQHQPLLLIFGVLFLLGCVYYQQEHKSNKNRVVTYCIL